MRPAVRVGLLALALGALAGPVRAVEGQEPESPTPAPAPAVPDAEKTRVPRRPGRLSAFVGGTLAAAASDFAGQRTFTEFAEEGRLDADYSRQTGPGFELGLAYALGRHFGVAASFNLLKRTLGSTYTASIPHPLFLDRPREATGSADGLSYRERGWHLDLLLQSERGPFRYAAFAGPSYVRVEASLLEPLQYRQAYPYDSVEVTGVPRATASASALGFNAGGTLDYRFGQRVGAGLLVRYHQVRAEVPQAPEDLVKIDAGGLQIGLGLRINVW